MAAWLARWLVGSIENNDNFDKLENVEAARPCAGKFFVQAETFSGSAFCRHGLFQAGPFLFRQGLFQALYEWCGRWVDVFAYVFLFPQAHLIYPLNK